MDPKVGRRKEGSTPPPSHAGGEVPLTPSLLIPIIVAVIVIVLTLVYFFTRKVRRGRFILIVGPCDAGKTTLFSRVLDGPSNVTTVTSLIPNELEYFPTNGKPALIIKDLPGHDRVQIKFWDGNKAGARGIICVVDAAAGNKGIREAADVLYRVLTDPSVLSSCPSLFIFANKQDQPMSKGSKVIRNQLEKELTTLRMTKSASLTSTGGKDSSRILGRQDKDFDFDQLTQLKIQFGEGTANTGNKEALEIIDWLDATA